MLQIEQLQIWGPHIFKTICLLESVYLELNWLIKKKWQYNFNILLHLLLWVRVAPVTRWPRLPYAADRCSAMFVCKSSDWWSGYIVIVYKRDRHVSRLVIQEICFYCVPAREADSYTHVSDSHTKWRLSEQCTIYRAQVTQPLSPAVIGLSSSGFGAIWTGRWLSERTGRGGAGAGPRRLSYGNERA